MAPRPSPIRDRYGDVIRRSRITPEEREYVERYLKVKTAGPERENRRVGIRRITPLVAPIASAN